MLTQLNATHCDLIIRQARQANLMGLLAYRIREAGLLERIPSKGRWHLIAALSLVERQEKAIRYEVDCIVRALGKEGGQLILLKGAAYVMAQRRVAQGRTFADIDLLVPKSRIDAVESELLIHGWQAGEYTAYDQRYYRQWMHEIPPLRHVKRGTTIDVHHNILPETARTKVYIQLMMEAAQPLSIERNLYVLAPIDMFLHSATHLFHEGNFEKGLRDLFDLGTLLEELAAQDDFWRDLVPRARQLGLARIVFYGLRYTHRVLNTFIPEDVMKDASANAPNFVVLKIMDVLYDYALQPLHVSTASRIASLSRFLLFIRSHFLKMPLHLLIFHLSHKAFFKPKESAEM